MTWRFFLIQMLGLPHKVRGDYGTENVLVAEMMRELHGLENSFIYGRSTSNQVRSCTFCHNNCYTIIRVYIDY